MNILAEKIFTSQSKKNKTVLSTFTTSYTLADVERQMNEYVEILSKEGNLKGKKVAVLVPSVFSYLSLLLAVNKVQACFVPLSGQFRTDDLKAILDSVNPDIVFTIAEHQGFSFGALFQEWAESSKEKKVIYQESGSSRWERKAYEGEESVGEENLIGTMIASSSGSTGVPKGIVLSVEALDNWTPRVREMLALKQTDVCFLTIPGTATAGLCFLLLALKEAVHFNVPDRFDPIDMVRQMDTHDCNKLITTPSICKAIHVFAKSAAPQVLEKLTLCSLSGELITDEFRSTMKDTGLQFISIYGASESGAMGYGKDIIKNLHMSKVEGVEYRLVQADPEVKIGELVVRSNQSFYEYYKQPSLTKEVLHDGWFSTGDLVQEIDDHTYEIIERVKNVIKKGGQQVIPGEVEYILNQHADVKDCVVVGVPHKVYGEQVIGFIVPNREVDVKSLHAYCQPKIASYKIPDRFVCIDEIPTVQGKIDRVSLRQKAREKVTR